jgi:hypothetical protein
MTAFFFSGLFQATGTDTSSHEPRLTDSGTTSTIKCSRLQPLCKVGVLLNHLAEYRFADIHDRRYWDLWVDYQDIAKKSNDLGK